MKPPCAIPRKRCSTEAVFHSKATLRRFSPAISIPTWIYNTITPLVSNQLNHLNPSSSTRNPRKLDTPLQHLTPNTQYKIQNTRYIIIELTLNKARHDFTPRLQQRMTDHDLEEPLQPLAAMLNDIVTEPIREYFAR